MTRIFLGTSLLWTMAWGCRYGPDDFARQVKEGDAVLVETTPPAGLSPEVDSLHQVLYQGEFGATAQPTGQRVRMLAWLVTLELDQDGLQSLKALCRTVEGMVGADKLDRAQMGSREATKYGLIYAELIEILAQGTLPDPETASDLATRLKAARALVHRDSSPFKRQRQRAAGVIDAIAAWMRTLGPDQVDQLSQARFFLRRRAGPLVNPGFYEWVVGTHWDAGDFDTLRFTGAAEQKGGMDLGGLWQSEEYRVQPQPHLRLLQARAIMALAVTEPGLVEAIEVLQGQRSPLDFAKTVD